MAPSDIEQPLEASPHKKKRNETACLYEIFKAVGGGNDPHKTMGGGWNNSEACPYNTTTGHSCMGIWSKIDPMPNCTWAGVFCIQGYVRQLHFKGLGLSGHLDVKALTEPLSCLERLETFDIQNNSLSGSVPSELPQLSQISKWFLQDNKFSGSIPDSFGNTPTWFLNWLDLSGNELTGSIPAGFGANGSSTLRNLQVLNLNVNKLQGTIPAALGLSTSLNTLTISYNQLTGTIPSTFGLNWNCSTCSNWQDWVTFDSNQLTGSIPENMTKLPLINLNLTNNHLTGTIPDGFCNGGYTNMLLRQNNLTGTLPSCLGASPFVPLSNPMGNFDVSFNRLTGTLPEGIYNWAGLTAFQCISNQLEGTIPANSFNQSQLEILNIGYNKFTGTLPNITSTSVFALWFSNNKFTGSIPQAWNALSNLESIDGHDNKLSGSVDPLLGSKNGSILSKSLYFVNLMGNEFTGTFPSLENYKGLRFAGFSNNEFSGQVPDLPANITSAFFHGNFFSGDVGDKSSPIDAKAVLAVPGNLLNAPKEPTWILNDDPLSNHKNLMNNVPEEVNLYIGLYVAIIALYLIARGFSPVALKTSCLSGNKLCCGQPVGNARQELFAALQKVFFAILLISVVMAVLYVKGPHRYDERTIMGAVSMTYTTGMASFVTSALVSISVPLLWLYIANIPQLKKSSAGSGISRIRQATCSALTASLLGVLALMVYMAGHAAFMLNSFWRAIPITETAYQILPFLALADILLPKLTTRIMEKIVYGIGGDDIALEEFRRFAGPVTQWLLPAVLAMVVNQNCGGLWWQWYAPQCTQSYPIGKGPFDYCDGQLRPANYDVKAAPWNMGTSGCTILTHAEDGVPGICSARWMRPNRCTMAVMEVVFPFFFARVAFSTMGPMAFLVAARILRFFRRKFPSCSRCLCCSKSDAPVAGSPPSSRPASHRVPKEATPQRPPTETQPDISKLAEKGNAVDEPDTPPQKREEPEPEEPGTAAPDYTASGASGAGVSFPIHSAARPESDRYEGPPVQSFTSETSGQPKHSFNSEPGPVAPAVRSNQVPSYGVPVRSFQPAQGSWSAPGWLTNTAFHLPGPLVVSVIGAAIAAYVVYYLESRVYNHRDKNMKLLDDKADLASAAVAFLITIVVLGAITSYLRWGNKKWTWQWDIDLLDSLTEKSFDMDIANNISIGFAWSFVCPPIGFACLIYVLVAKDIMALAQDEFHDELAWKRVQGRGGQITAAAWGMGTPLSISPSSLLVGMIPALAFIYAHLFMTDKETVVMVVPIVFAVVAVFSIAWWFISCRTSSLGDAQISQEDEEE